MDLLIQNSRFKIRNSQITVMFNLNFTSTPKSISAPKSPKGDFHKVLIFSVSPPRRIRGQKR
jgi:hypothetical protein